MSLRVLLADENLAVQKLVELTLQNEDIKVISTDNGLSALDIALKRTPDLILADFNLEGLDIYTFVEKIRQSGRLSDVPIILLINATETFDPEHLRSAGVQAFFKKPIDSQELLEEIRRLTGDAVQDAEESVSAPDNSEPEMSRHFQEKDNDDAEEMEAALGWSASFDPDSEFEAESAADAEQPEEQTVVSPPPAAPSAETKLQEIASPSFDEAGLNEAIRRQVRASIEKVTADILPGLLKSAVSAEVVTSIIEKVAGEAVSAIAESEVKKEIARLQTGA